MISRQYESDEVICVRCDLIMVPSFFTSDFVPVSTTTSDCHKIIDSWTVTNNLLKSPCFPWLVRRSSNTHLWVSFSWGRSHRPSHFSKPSEHPDTPSLAWLQLISVSLSYSFNIGPLRCVILVNQTSVLSNSQITIKSQSKPIPLHLTVLPGFTLQFWP